MSPRETVGRTAVRRRETPLSESDVAGRASASASW